MDRSLCIRRLYEKDYNRDFIQRVHIRNNVKNDQKYYMESCPEENTILYWKTRGNRVFILDDDRKHWTEVCVSSEWMKRHHKEISREEFEGEMVLEKI